MLEHPAHIVLLQLVSVLSQGYWWSVKLFHDCERNCLVVEVLAKDLFAKHRNKESARTSDRNRYEVINRSDWLDERCSSSAIPPRNFSIVNANAVSF